MAPRRVAVLGGGMAGLAAAWHLSRPDGPRPHVTVYQRGGRLGGKAASSRGVHGRIEEHGLHVWLGYYDNAFRLVRDCYEELDRSHRDPSCPIASWRDAFLPASTIGLHDGHPWVATFPENHETPGDARRGSSVPAAVDLVSRATALLMRLGVSLSSERPEPARAVLSTRARPPSEPSGLPAVVAALTAFAAAGQHDQQRFAAVVDLLLTVVRGVTVDGLVGRGFGAVDHVDFRDWLVRHGASPGAVNGPIVRGMYDLVFAYEGGDRSRPRFAAGLGLQLANRMFFDYKGAIFWKMRAGMGDVVVAPLYEVLRRRGVRFAFFHRVDHLHVERGAIAAVTLGRQVDAAGYDPLVRVRGLPVFRPAGPFEHHGWGQRDVAAVRLEAGRDYDALVLAVSLGMVPHTCQELLAADPRWQAMVDHVGTVGTQALQLWLRRDERSLGWRAPSATVTGFGAPFDTFSSMSHSVALEDWPVGAEPLTSASFCGVRSDSGAHPREFVASRLPELWPTVADDDIVSEYWRIDDDPSDRYVQSLPGSGQYRLAADASGFAHLALAGDWIDSGLNAGCVEAAVLSGFQAAAAVEAFDA